MPSDYDRNIYYSPEAWGLKVVAEIEYSSGSYEFDTRVVWLDEMTGKLYTAQDSGCSCPTPFEDINTLEDLDELISIDPLRDEITDKLGYSGCCANVADTRDFLNKVEATLTKVKGDAAP